VGYLELLKALGLSKPEVDCLVDSEQIINKVNRRLEGFSVAWVKAHKHNRSSSRREGYSALARAHSKINLSSRPAGCLD
jgi:hypothetical protein